MIKKSGTITLIMKRKMDCNILMWWELIILGNLRCYNRGGNENVKKGNRLVRQNNIFARPAHFFTYFFVVTTTIKLPKFTFYGER